MTMNQRLLRQVGHVLQGKLAPVARSITLSREPRNRRKQTQFIEILLNDDSISAFVKNEPKFQKNAPKSLLWLRLRHFDYARYVR